VELLGPQAKLDWALQKLEALDRECKLWAESQPLFIADEFDDEAGCHVLRLRSRHDRDLVLRMGLMVGDVVHNARSSLDQAAWLLACRSNSVEKLWEPSTAWKISFPVTWDEERFKNHRVLPFFDEDAIAVLEGLQPYKGGNVEDCIGHLDRLWNIDKHRVIHSSNVNLGIDKVRFRPGAINAIRDVIENPPVTTWSLPLERIEDGAEIARIRFNEGLGPPHTKVKVEGQPTCEIAFGSGEFCFPVDALGGLLVAVARALTRIEGLPETPS
jgi:hypothetical protein